MERAGEFDWILSFPHAAEGSLLCDSGINPGCEGCSIRHDLRNSPRGAWQEDPLL